MSVDFILRLLVSLVLLAVMGAAARGIWWLLHPASALEIRSFEVVKGGEVQKGQLEMASRILTSRLRDITSVLHPDAAAGRDRSADLGLQIQGPSLPEVVLGEKEFNLRAFNVDVGGIFGTVYRTLYNGPVLQGAVILNGNGVEVLAEYKGDGHTALGRFSSTAGSSLDEAIEKLAYKIVLDFCRHNEAQFAQISDEDFRLYIDAMREYRYYEESRGHSEAEMERHARAMASILEKCSAKEQTSSIIYSALDAVYRYLNVPEQTQSLLEKVVEANPNDANARKKLASIRDQIAVRERLAGDDNVVTVDELRKQAPLTSVHAAEAIAKVKEPQPVTVAILADGNGPVNEELKAFFLPGGSEGSDAFSLTPNLGSLVATLCPAAKILPVKALTDSDFVRGLKEAQEKGARVALIAVGGPKESKLRAEAIEEARRKGNMLILAAAGNDQSERKVYPAADAGVVAVGAADGAGHRARFSNYGSWVRLMAPGVDIVTLDRDGKPRQNSGSSFAAAIAAGTAAITVSAKPSLSVEALERILEETATAMGTAKGKSAGRVDALAAVTKAAGK